MSCRSVVCLSVCVSHDCEPCKNGWTDRDAVCRVGQKIHISDGGRRLAPAGEDDESTLSWRRCSVMSNYCDHLSYCVIGLHINFLAFITDRVSEENNKFGRVRPFVWFHSSFCTNWPLTLILARVWVYNDRRPELKIKVIGQGQGLRYIRRPTCIQIYIAPKSWEQIWGAGIGWLDVKADWKRWKFRWRLKVGRVSMERMFACR